MISSPDDYFKVELPNSIAPGQTADGKLKLSDFGKGNNFEKSFTFELNDENKSRFTVPVKRAIRNSEPVKSGTSGH